MGVRLARRGGRAGEVVRAAAAVVSNASAWDTQRLLPPGAAPAAWRSEALQTPRTGSFVHLHAGARGGGGGARRARGGRRGRGGARPRPAACAGAGRAPRTPYMRLCMAGRCISRAVAVRDLRRRACSPFKCMADWPRCVCSPLAALPRLGCGRTRSSAKAVDTGGAEMRALRGSLARSHASGRARLHQSWRRAPAQVPLQRGDAEQQRALAGAGIDAEGLPPDLECHHLFVNSWEDLDAPQASGPAARAPLRRLQRMQRRACDTALGQPGQALPLKPKGVR